MIRRALLVLLLCLNLGVALWWALHDPAPPPPPPPPEAGVGSLVLLGEAEAEGLARDAEPLAPAGPLAADATCLSIGPFATPAALRAAMTVLTPEVERIQFREVPATALRGYRVFLPASGSREQALETARALAGRGVRDYYVVTAGEQENTVSLGLFRELGNAEARRDALMALGFEAVLEPRTEDVAQWWIDLAAAPGFEWRAWLGEPDGIEARAAECR